VSHLPGRRLAELTASLSERYRASAGAAGSGLRMAPLSPDEVAAYCAFRLPATVAATESALRSLADACPGLIARGVLDIGGGPGAGMFAACRTFASVEWAQVLDANREMMRAGAEIAGSALGPAPSPHLTWVQADLGRIGSLDPADLAIAAYVLAELPPPTAGRLIGLAAAAARAVVVVEPGTPAGYRRVLAARDALLAAGMVVAAPCPHGSACPMGAGDWCHFSVRVARSKVHRLAKGGSLGHEDEKFSYVAAVHADAARAVVPARARIVRHPEWRRAAVVLRLCVEPPALETCVVPRSAGDAYRAARRAAWGAPWPRGAS
jgi:ribosomal protein RSM22 (predicted rRNA methylase)